MRKQNIWKNNRKNGKRFLGLLTVLILIVDTSEWMFMSMETK